MQITRFGAIFVVFFLLAGLFYSSFSGPGSFELKFFLMGPIIVCVVAAAHMWEYKVGLPEALRMCFSFKSTASNAIVVLLIVWFLAFITEANSCHIGRDEGELQAKAVHLKLKILQEERAKKQ